VYHGMETSDEVLLGGEDDQGAQRFGVEWRMGVCGFRGRGVWGRMASRVG